MTVLEMINYLNTYPMECEVAMFKPMENSPSEVLIDDTDGVCVYLTIGNKLL